MPHPVEVRTLLESRLVEQALLMARELQAADDDAPDGRVPADAELVAVRAGRELTRKALEAALQAQADGAEERGHPPVPAPAAGDATRRTRPRRPRRSRAAGDYGF
jgi:hypothetical protein